MCPISTGTGGAQGVVAGVVAIGMVYAALDAFGFQRKIRLVGAAVGIFIAIEVGAEEHWAWIDSDRYRRLLAVLRRGGSKAGWTDLVISARRTVLPLPEVE